MKPNNINQRITIEYLSSVYLTDNFSYTVDKATKIISKFRKRMPFEAIAFTGSSGAALAYPLSYKLKIPLIHIRKSIRDNHYGSKLEGLNDCASYIIVDDFINSGRTIKKIISEINKGNAYKKSECVGIYLFDDDLAQFNGIRIIK